MSRQIPIFVSTGVPTFDDLPFEDQIGTVRHVQSENRDYVCVATSLNAREQWQLYDVNSGAITPTEITAGDVTSAQLATIARTGSRSVISTRPMIFKTASTSDNRRTALVGFCAPCDFSAVQFVFCNWGNLNTALITPEAPGTNPIFVRAAVQGFSLTAPGDSVTANIVPVLFNGRDVAQIDPGDDMESDMTPFARKKGEWAYSRVEFQVDAQLPIPGDPSVTTPTTGGTFSDGTVWLGVSWVYAGELEGKMNSFSTVLSGGTATQSIVVTPPTAPDGVRGYHIYIPRADANSVNATMYESQLGIVNIGTNVTVSAFASSTYSVGLRGASMLQTMPQGGATLATTLAGLPAVNMGEGYTGNDGVPFGFTISQIRSAGTVGPNFILGLTPGKINRGVLIIGDSMMHFSCDRGFDGFGSRQGSYLWRHLIAQTRAIAYDPNITPNHGMILGSHAGETASNFALYGGVRRSRLAKYPTDSFSNYGTNDIFGAVPSVTLLSYLITIANRMSSRKLHHRQATILPRINGTTGGYTDITTQTRQGLYEPYRIQTNENIRGTNSAGLVIVGERPMQVRTVNRAYNFDFTVAADGQATTWAPWRPFVAGSEKVYLDGVRKFVTTDYTYSATQAIGGVTYGAGIQFNSAPTAGAIVTIDYTSAPSFKYLSSNPDLVDTYDAAAAIECGPSGSLQVNGGLWPVDPTVYQAARAATGMTATTLTDTTLSNAQDLWRGYTIEITADAGTPTAIGQVRVIGSYDPSAHTFAVDTWTVTPSATATYRITNVYTQEGIHPTTRSHMIIAQDLDAKDFYSSAA